MDTASTGSRRRLALIFAHFAALFRNEPGAFVKTDILDRIANVLGVDVSELLESVKDEGE